MTRENQTSKTSKTSKRTGTRRGANAAGTAGAGSAGTGSRRAARSYPKTDLRRLADEARGATVYLAEKHSIALALADALPGHRVNLGACIRCGDVVITWLSGHLLEQAPPEAYDARFKAWSRATLPIIPAHFQLLPRAERGAAEQLEVIRTLLSVCPAAVNAADFDREGQLLVDEVLELVHYTGPVQRLQTRALDVTSLRRELARMQDNERFAGMREAARARSQLDWLAGINLTRAMTIHGRQCGAQGVLSLGRVQTPTLALVVARDLEIENFVPKPFYKLTCPFAAEAGILQTRLVVDADMKGADSEKRLTDRDEALRIQALVSGKPGEVVQVESKRVQEAAPLPYNLTELQKEASSRFGLGAQATLQACQRMYEAKFISYPRTDCQYLPVEQFKDAAGVLQAIGSFEGMQAMVAACDTARRSAAWNTAKVSAHHAIIPTLEPATGLSDREAKVYTLICRRYAWQFLPPHIFTRTRVDVRCEETLWRANGRVEESPGWTLFKDAGPALAAKKSREAREEDKAAKDVILPKVATNEKVMAGEVSVEEAMTTPPARFTEGTLVDAMENIQRYISGASAEDEKILKKTEGLGTVATRAGIIETLFARNYLVRQGKSLLSTGLGRDVITNSPAVIRDPLMTADMERALSDIQEGRRNGAEYVASYAATLPGVIAEIFATAASYTPEPGAAPAARGRAGKAGRASAAPSGAAPAAETGETADTPLCPQCGAPLVQRTGPRGSFWGCSTFPKCRCTVPDREGAPDFAARGFPRTAQTSGAPQEARAPSSARQSGTAQATSPASSQSASSRRAGAAQAADGRICPRCGKPLVLRTSARGPFFGCTGFPSCRFTQDAGDTSPSPEQTFGQAQEQALSGSAAAGRSRPAGSRQTAVGTRQEQGDTPVCPRCGRPLVRRTSARGPFLGCSGYPSCRFTRDLQEQGEERGEGPGFEPQSQLPDRRFDQGTGRTSPARREPAASRTVPFGTRTVPGRLPGTAAAPGMPVPQGPASMPASGPDRILAGTMPEPPEMPDLPWDMPEPPDMFEPADMPEPPDMEDVPWDADTDAAYDEWAWQSSQDEQPR